MKKAVFLILFWQKFDYLSIDKIYSLQLLRVTSTYVFKLCIEEMFRFVILYNLKNKTPSISLHQCINRIIAQNTHSTSYKLKYVQIKNSAQKCHLHPREFHSNSRHLRFSQRDSGEKRIFTSVSGLNSSSSLRRYISLRGLFPLPCARAEIFHLREPGTQHSGGDW